MKRVFAGDLLMKTREKGRDWTMMIAIAISVVFVAFIGLEAYRTETLEAQNKAEIIRQMKDTFKAQIDDGFYAADPCKPQYSMDNGKTWIDYDPSVAKLGLMIRTVCPDGYKESK